VGVVAQRGGEVDRPDAGQRADDQVAQAGHDVWAGPGAQLRGVLGEGHIVHPVQAVLDRPVPPQEVGEPGGAGLGVGEAGDRKDGHGPPPSGAKLAGLAGDLEDLGGVREAEVAHGDGLEGAQLHPAVGAVAGAVGDGHVCQGMAAQRSSSRGWLALTTSR
jgi:hypothetical protein